MSDLFLRGVSRARHGDAILKDVSLTVPAGKITGFLGNDVSGKTTALKVIAGVEKCDDGSVIFDGRDLTRDKPGARNVALVLRTDSLLPHKSVYDNIAFPLRIADFDKATIDDRVRGVADHFGLSETLKLKPKKLGERDRYAISIARALVRDPAVYLVAQPEGTAQGALIALAREEMTRLRDEYQRTIVYATDRVDELTGFADWIVAFDEGQVVQEGTPGEIYGRPATITVAGMFGAVLRTATVRAVADATATVRLKNGTEVTLEVLPERALVGENVTVAIWPDSMKGAGGTLVAEHCHLFDEAGESLDPL